MPSKSRRTSPASPSEASVLRDEHALLAAYETRPTRPKRSSSERSKEFRAKRKKYEGELQHEVDSLRREVAELNMRRNIWQEKLVHVRSNISGSLTKVVREYYLVFQHGLAVSRSGETVRENPKTKYQLDFLHQSMDENVLVNGRVGIPALMEMWRKYTVGHENLFVEVGDVTLFGPDENPVVLLFTKVHAQIARSTFELMFAPALEKEDLVAKFVGKEVTYEARTFFHFNADGRINSIDHDLSIVDGLLNSGCPLEDVLYLMEHFQCKPLERWSINPDEKLQEDLQIKIESVQITSTSPKDSTKRQKKHTDADVKEETPSSDDDSDSERRKLTMNFLLS